MPPSKRFSTELAQVESRLRQAQIRLDCTILNEKERATARRVRDGLRDVAARLRDLVAWEQELAA